MIVVQLSSTLINAAVRKQSVLSPKLKIWADNTERCCVTNSDHSQRYGDYKEIIEDST